MKGKGVESKGLILLLFRGDDDAGRRTATSRNGYGKGGEVRLILTKHCLGNASRR